jgi:hypothetical protein
LLPLDVVELVVAAVASAAEELELVIAAAAMTAYGLRS